MGKKLALISFSLVIALYGITYFSVAPKVYACKNKEFVVVIDPGHGGIDPGVVGKTTGVKESNLNLEISKSLKKRFYAEGVTALLTRTNDNGLYGNLTNGFKLRDLENRVKIAREVNADIFISVHINEYVDVSRRGAQVFYKVGCEKSKSMARCIQTQLNGLEESVREYSPLAGDYYVLNNAVCPSVIVECGFLSNAEDEKLLLDKAYREKVAQGIYYGVVTFLQKD